MDFKFLQNQVSKKWVILSPRRAKRPDEAINAKIECPFCAGNEEGQDEAYRVPARNAMQSVEGGRGLKGDMGWKIRVLPNKFPFAPIHEVIIHSPDHEKSFDQLPLLQNELILQTYRQRYQVHKDKGQVYIFHNHGRQGGESLPHPHSQLVVIPDHVKLDIPPVDFKKTKEKFHETDHFIIFSPLSSEWPDEAWILPKNSLKSYSNATDEELKDLAKILYRLIQIFDLRHGNEFAFNFYISPRDDWYLRIVPRLKTLGGFELGTNVGVNTQDPKQTIAFIKEHFNSPDEEKIKTVHRADYKKAV